MNYIQYGKDHFHGNSARWGVDGLFMSGQVEQMIALFGKDLTADSLTFIVRSRALDDTGDAYAFLIDSNGKVLQTSDGKIILVRAAFQNWMDFKPGAPLDLYNVYGGQNIGRFYVTDVEQVSRKTVKFTCTDCIGLLAAAGNHVGGIYTGETVAEVLREIMTGVSFSYSVANDVGAVQVFGRLPLANKRENLGKLLVATGATVTERNGKMEIKYLGAGSPSTIYQRNIYMRKQADVQRVHPATSVNVTEHNFYALQTDETVTLFDNTIEITAANNQLVIFDEPCHDLKWNGSALPVGWDSGANYAVVTGIGTLTGQKYTHTRRQISKSTGVTSDERIEEITDNELIGYHNSDYVAQRMVNWYKLRTFVNFSELDPNGTLMPGTPVNMTDPFGTARTGWVQKKTFPIGNKTLATLSVAVDWKPGPWGSGLDAWKLFEESQTWTVPAGVTQVTFYLGSGGNGGEGGQKGGDGEDGSVGEGVKGGSGGAPGAGGPPGKVHQVSFAVTPGDTITVTIGAGGGGGAKNGGAGSEGAATTITHNNTTYTSADGTVPENGFTNVFTGDIYSETGPEGVPGADGGAHISSGLVAGNVVDTQTWYGGQPGTNQLNHDYGLYGIGGGGSGAAYGADGSNGTNGFYTSTRVVGGDGADGPDAILKPHTPKWGYGGIGGSGGGGGGAGGPAEGPNRQLYPGPGGTGGDGSIGGDGAPGWALALYKAA